jgi:glycosyltransferase involved in cell wall biosynthesis
MSGRRGERRDGSARIVVDASATDPGPSGARTRLVELFRAYASRPRRHEVVILEPRGRELAGIGDFDDLQPVGAGRVRRIAVEPAPPAWRRLLARYPHRELLASLGATALQVETLPLPRGVDLPLLLTIHDLRDLAPGGSRLRAAYLERVLPAAIPSRVVAVMVPSDDTASRLARLRVERERIAVVRNGRDESVRRIEDEALLAAVRGRLALPPRFVLALGHLEPRKGLSVLIDALRELRSERRHGDVALVLAGRDRGELARLRACAARAPAVPLCAPGIVDPDVRDALYTLASVVVVPSRVEGFGMVAIEAMACGTPVIVADATALPETVAGAARTFAPGDARALARELARLLDDPVLRAEFVARGRQRAGELRWAAAADALEGVYDAVAAASAQRSSSSASS